MDTFVIGDGTGVIVFDTSNHPRLSKQIANMSYTKVFSPKYENGKLITYVHTFIATAYPLHIVESGNLSSSVSTKSYKTIKDIEDMRCPTKVNMILKFINKLEPRQLKNCLPTFANALDPKSDLIDVTMSPTLVKKFLSGCHNQFQSTTNTLYV